MYNQEDILRKFEEILSGNIHDAASRYFSGEMSGAESEAFALVMEKHEDLREEVRLQGLALRAAHVAGRSGVREKLDQASARAKQRSQRRTQSRLRKNMVRLAIPAIAAMLVLALVPIWERPASAPQLYRYAEVNAFGVLHPPRSAGAASLAGLYRVSDANVAFVKVPGSYQLAFLAPDSLASAAWLAAARKKQGLEELSRDPFLRQQLCLAMGDLGLPVQHPIEIQKRRLEAAQETRWAGRVLNYPLFTGLIIEEDPALDVSFGTQVASLPLSPPAEAESVGNWKWTQEDSKVKEFRL